MHSIRKVLAICLSFLFYSIESAVSLDYIEYRVYFQKAIENYKLNRFELAEDNFHTILNNYRDYRDPAAHLMLAKSQYHKGDWDQAFRTCKSYLSNYPKSPYEYHAQILLGDILLLQGEITSAFENYLRIRPILSDSTQLQGIDKRLLICISNDLKPHRIEGLLFQEQDKSNQSILNLARAYKAWKNGNSYEFELILRGKNRSDFPYIYRKLFESLYTASNRKFFKQCDIAIILPITGKDSSPSLSYLAGLSEFIDDNLNNIASRFIVFDTESNDVKVWKILQKISLSRNINCILGPIKDSHILIASGTTSSIPILIPKTNLAGISEYSENIFFLTPTVKTIARRTAELLVEEMGLEYIAILSPGDDNSSNITKYFMQELNQLGISPVAIEWYYDSPENISRQFKSIRKKAWSLKSEEDQSTNMMDMTIDSLEGLFDVDVEDFFDLPDYNKNKKMTKKDSSKIFLNTIQALYLPLRQGELTYIGTQVPLYNLETIIIGNEYWLDMDVLNQDLIGPHVQGMRIISDVRSPKIMNTKLQFSNFYALGFDHGDFINSISMRSNGTRRSFYQNLKNQNFFNGLATSIKFGGKNKNSNQSAQVLEYRKKSIISIGMFDGDSIEVMFP